MICNWKNCTTKRLFLESFKLVLFPDWLFRNFSKSSQDSVMIIKKESKSLGNVPTGKVHLNQWSNRVTFA